MTEITCRCGATTLTLTGAPILTSSCHCQSCREAAGQLADLPGATPITDAHGATPFVLWRKDRVAVTRGAGTLRAHTLRDGGTRRAVATCCNSPMYLNFNGGHWLSLYAARFDNPPPIQMRTMLMDAEPGTVPDDGIPGARRQSARFMLKLLGAWAATGFRFFKMEPMPKLEEPQ